METIECEGALEEWVVARERKVELIDYMDYDV